MKLLCNDEEAAAELADILYATSAYVQLEKGVGVTIGDVLDILSSKEKVQAMVYDVKEKTQADWSFMAYLEMLREQESPLLHAMVTTLEKQKDRKLPDLRF